MRKLSIALVSFSLILAGCGVKGPPEPPRPDTFPRTYPAPDPLPKPDQPPPAKTDTTDQPITY